MCKNPRTKKIWIVADDFTGALDTAVKFRNCGACVRVFTGPDMLSADPFSECDVVAIDTESRHLDAKQAYGRAAKAFALGKKYGAEVFYKKTDSALRGRIGAEIAALRDTIGETVHFVPAMPQLERVAINGRYIIEGVPVSESEFSRDPIDPVSKSDIRQLLREDTKKKTAVICRNQPTDDATADILVYDAETEGDLKALARKLADRCALAGCSGFAEHLSGNMRFYQRELPSFGGTEKWVAVCGSMHPRARQQIEKAREQGLCTMAIPVSQLLRWRRQSDDGRHKLLEQIDEITSMSEEVILYTETDETESSTANDSAEIADSLGMLSSCIADKFPETLQILIGGDTAYAAMRRGEYKKIMPILEAEPGAVLMYAERDRRSHWFLTRAGSFGRDDFYTNIRHKPYT